MLANSLLHGGEHDFVLCRRWVQRRNSPSGAEDHSSIRQILDLKKVGEITTIDIPTSGRFIDELMDLSDGAHMHAAYRFVTDDNLPPLHE